MSVCPGVCSYCTQYSHTHTYMLYKSVLQTCSLGEPGPCWEHTQQESTTNWLLIFGGTAGLIRLANSGELRKTLSPAPAQTHINTYLESPPPPISVHPWWPARLLGKRENMTGSLNDFADLI